MPPADAPALDARRLEAFAAALRAQPGRRVYREALWNAFSTAFPNVRGPEQRAWFLAALEALAGDGVLRLPSRQGGRWDTALLPHVPVSVDLVYAPAPPRDDTWRREPWHPRLAWVPRLARLADDHLAFLRRVQQGLVEGWFGEPAPLRYRSLQLTGDEKRLDVLLRSALFGEGHLTADLLGVRSYPPPLAWESVGERPAVVVFENADAFGVARRALAALSDPPYGMVAYGCGAVFQQSVQHLATIGRPVARIDYVGDLDRPGLDIARLSGASAALAGLPAVTPAPGVHRAMLDAAAHFGHPLGWPYESARAIDADLARVEWLAPEVRSDALAILAAGRRIPEEVLGPREMREWLGSLAVAW
ncbi:MAG TPA: hypothetical protein VGB15_19020 [Longimicrobium sp.]|jgi:hypothetical protein